MAPFSRVKRDIAAVSMHRLPTGVVVFDMGVNFVGAVRIHTPGNITSGMIELTHGEILNPDGTVNNSFAGKMDIQVDRHILGPAAPAWLRPRFTWHGFQYVAVNVTGFELDLSLESVVGMQVGCWPHRSHCCAGRSSATVLASTTGYPSCFVPVCGAMKAKHV
jgi:alpha-L-rhamnosidase